MKNYISENISYLVNKVRSSQDEFGAMFDLKKSSVSSYVSKKALPKIDTIQRICEYFNITIDEFINTDLSDKKNALAGPKTTTKADTNTENIAKEIQLRDELIAMYKDKIEALTKEIKHDEALARIEQKVDQSNIIFKELEEHFEYLNLKENLEKAKSLKGQKK
ncbi:helix-turn-helix domain-containing protein [Flavobacterium sp. J27]|uniref:helix-turn-helix domain-containing protein n=1 Tax=Flavobacterium sp. J27 TaxID=2060419 RepID=UPI00103244D8|nr:helix-turn-helix domain-containing protein [Flavobacterium sp. J27]